MTTTILISVEAARARVEQYRQAWEDALREKDEALALCVREKAHMPDGYWQKEYRARALYASAQQLLEVLDQGDS